MPALCEVCMKRPATVKTGYSVGGCMCIEYMCHACFDSERDKMNNAYHS